MCDVRRPPISMLHALTVTGVFLGWLPIGANAGTIGIQSQLTARRFNEFGPTAGLFLTPLEKAIFGLRILFAFLTFVQMGCAFFMLLIGRRQERDYQGRIPFIGYTFFSLLWLFITFILALITTRLEVREAIPLPIGVYFASGFAALASPVFMYTALIFLLLQRDAVAAVSGASKRSRTTGVITRIIASVLLFVMLVAAVIYEAIALNAVAPNSPLLNAVNGMLYLYLAAYEVLTALVVAVSVLLWKKRVPQISSPALDRFDSNVITPILLIICPLLVIRALFELSAAIITAHPSFVSHIDPIKVNLASVAIEGTTQFLIFTTALSFGFPLGLTRRQQ